MSKKRTKLKNSLLALILSIAMILTNFTGFTTAKADGLQDVTKTGLKFNTSADFPTVETVYKAGDGTITFTPATADTPATLTLDNATINRKEDGKDTYTTGYHGIILPDETYTINVVLKGNNKMEYCAQAFRPGMPASGNDVPNMNIKGDGKLTVENSRVGFNGFNYHIEDVTIQSNNLEDSILCGHESMTIENAIVTGSTIANNLHISPLELLDKGTITIKNSKINLSKNQANPVIYAAGSDGSKILIEDSDVELTAIGTTVAAIGGWVDDITVTNTKLTINSAKQGIYAINDSTKSGNAGKVTLNGTSVVNINSSEGVGIANLKSEGDTVVIGDTAKVTVSGVGGIRTYATSPISVTGEAELTVKGTKQVLYNDGIDTTGYTAPVGVDVDTTGDAASALAWDKTTSLQTYKYLHVYPKTVDVDITATAKDEVYDKTPKAGYDDTLFSFEPSSYTGGFTKTYFVKINDTYVKTTAANSGAKEDGAEPVYAGEYRVQFGIPEDVKYYECDKTLDFKIEPKEITVDVVVDNKEYDGTNSAKISSAGLNGVCAGDDVSCADGVTATFDNAEIGKNKVISFTTFSLTGKDAANYKLKEQPQNITADIGERVLKVIAKDKSIIYGDEPSNNGVTYEGFMKGDDESILKGTLDYEYNYTQYSDAGEYKITPKGLTADHYAVQFVDGTLTVNQKEVGLTWSAPENLKYDGTAKVPNLKVTGVREGDVYDVTASLTEGTDNKKDGTFTFTATAAPNKNYKLPENVVSPKYTIIETHVWGKPQFTWSEDGTKATATFICENSSSHTDTLDAVVTSELTEKATGTKKGEITYTATVTKDGKTYTDTKKVPTQISDIEKINQGILETQVRVSDDMPNTSIHGMNLDIARKLITEEEVKSVDSGENIRIYLDATNINDTVSKEDKSLVQKVLVDILQKRIHESLYSVSQVKSGTYYIDLSLYKQVGDKAADKLHDTGDNKIKISVEIPKEIQAANRVYDIVRVHDNKAEVLDSVYDSTAKTLTFETTKFSTYAIVYSELLRYTPSVPSVPSGPVNPMVTPAPATTPSATPSVSESPAPGTTPAVSESPAPGTTPAVSENPSATPVVTGEPTATPAVTTEPTVKPTKTPSGTEKDDDDAVFGKLKAKAVNSKKHKTTLKW